LSSRAAGRATLLAAVPRTPEIVFLDEMADGKSRFANVSEVSIVACGTSWTRPAGRKVHDDAWPVFLSKSITEANAVIGPYLDSKTLTVCIANRRNRDTCAQSERQMRISPRGDLAT